MTKKEDFRRPLLRWYSINRRDLPWRRTREPYAILVSEFMLQQTQVTSVLPYFRKWLERFPDFAALASASETDVLCTWEGLGYYGRARNLHATARIVVDRHRGNLPESIQELQELPGIGKYTAHALASFAFDQRVPIVEANTARVLARLFNIRSPIDSTTGRNQLWKRAAVLVPERDSSTYNSALVDLGAMICLPRKPKCHFCPVKKFCRGRTSESLPIKKCRPKPRQLLENHALVVKPNKVLLKQACQRWRGMWILPPLHGSSTKNRAIYSATFPFTNHRVTLQVFRQYRSEIDPNCERWFSLSALNSIPIPSPHRRAINKLLD